MSSKWIDTNGAGADRREVRLLDYACGSGTVSKVGRSLFASQLPLTHDKYDRLGL